MSKNQNNFLAKLFRIFVYIAPAILFFSYWPNFYLGASESMNFEFSLPLIWLVLFDILCFILIIKNHKFKNIFKYWYWLLFPIFLSISIAWSPNPPRGILTAGILWLIYFAVFSVFELKKYLKSDSTKQIFFKVFFYSTLVVCAWCWLQSILDLVGLNRENTLMCKGCITAMFGFPHPNGFAIEPQFMGNLLLAPTVLTAWIIMRESNLKKWFKGRSRGYDRVSEGASPVTTAPWDADDLWSTGASDPSPRTTFLIVFLLFIFSATLFLTFSRGAIYAFIAALIFMTIYYIVYTKSARPLFMWLILILAFLFTLNFQGIFAELSPTNDTYFSGISKSLNQLSLGLIDIREPVQNNNTTSDAVSIKDDEPETSNDSTFDGYVAESTDIRIKLNDGAIDVWKSSPTNLLFGVGLGGAGEALYQNGKTSHPKEIIQNQYFSLLLESGVIGIILLALTVILILKAVVKAKISGLILPLIIAYAVSLCFFAGLPNALHIYLLPAILFLFGRN